MVKRTFNDFSEGNPDNITVELSSAGGPAINTIAGAVTTVVSPPTR